MKIKSLNIVSHKHLRSLSFDFTYPKGHIRAGEPLDKICLMGQSATGKTTIIEVIKESLVTLKDVEILNGSELYPFSSLKFDGNVEFSHTSGPIIMHRNEVTCGGRTFKTLRNSGGGSVGNLISDDLKALYISSDVISRETIEILNQNPITLDSILNGEKTVNQISGSHPNIYIYEFLSNVNEQIWFSLLNDILEYRKSFTKMASELINKGIIGDVEKLNKRFSIWAAKNENPLKAFSELFNPILSRLNLEVDLSNTEYSIPIKSKINNEVIPISALSTGTKSLLISMLPLAQLDTSNAIIMIDEPERSIFPDMQIDLMSHYKRLAPSAQIIVATHSPFISAAFEPEERFILYFDDTNKVSVRRGESPIGDDPNDLLKNDFQIDYYNEFGKRAYRDYVNLKRQVLEESEQTKKDDLMIELSKLGDKYNF